ncbi:MAG: Zn-ribbon domain-containing OB-fold protein [Candidatus Binataceae bacterium]
MPEPAPSELYSMPPDGIPKLNGGRCCACGYVFFPPQSYGCEICGSSGDQLQPFALKGDGVLRSFATVHLHQGKGIEAPFTIGVILLDDGPAVRAILTQKTDAGLRIGERMHTAIVRASADEGGSANELRFTRREPT